MNRVLASVDEGMILYAALREFTNGGYTEIICPRCGNTLECVLGNSGSSIYCTLDGCIMASIRSI